MPEQVNRDTMAEARMAAPDETLRHGEPGNRRDIGLSLANHCSYIDAFVMTALEAIVGEAIQPTGDDWASAIRLRDTTRRRLLEMTGEPDRLAW